MALHCACRIGFVDHLYNNRYKIAFSTGLIVEIPIALCGSKYEHSKTLKIETSDNADAVPLANIKTDPINLFFVTAYVHPNSRRVLIDASASFQGTNLYRLTLVKGIFHPPSSRV
jgi:hypothetical protein